MKCTMQKNNAIGCTTLRFMFTLFRLGLFLPEDKIPNDYTLKSFANKYSV